MRHLPQRKSLSVCCRRAGSSRNRTWIPGDWMSLSTTATRCCILASITARFAVVLDLPVPPRNEWTEMTLATGSTFAWGTPLTELAGAPQQALKAFLRRDLLHFFRGSRLVDAEPLEAAVVEPHRGAAGLRVLRDRPL